MFFVGGVVLGILIWGCDAKAADLSTELNAGYHGEDQLRIGAQFQLSDHWYVDSGASVIKYNGFSSCVGVWDTTFLRRYPFAKKWFLEAGSGVAQWTAKTWAREDSATTWTFSNRVGLGYRLDKDTVVGVGWRHYSNGFYSPNTSKDFVGLRLTINLKG